MVETDMPDDNVIWRMRFVRWMTRTTDKLRINNTYFLSHGNNGYT